MTTKLIEVRDRMTCMVMLAVRLDCDAAQRSQEAAHAADDFHDEEDRYIERQRWLLARAGFGLESEDQRQYIFLIGLARPEVQYDPYGWPNSRTQRAVHHWLLEGDHFATLPDGAVVDVRVVLGEEPEVVESAQGAGWGR